MLALLSAGVAEGPGVAEHRSSRAHAHLGALSERRKASVSVKASVESGKMVREKKSPRYKKLGECLGMRGVEHGPRTGRYAEYRGWEDAHPGALIEVREPSVSAPVSAVVGVVTGAALAALPGRFRGTTQHSSAAVTGPGGGVPAFDVESDGRRLGGAPLRAAGRGRLLGGRHVKSDAGGAGHPKAMMSRRLEDLRSRRLLISRSVLQSK